MSWDNIECVLTNRTRMCEFVIVPSTIWKLLLELWSLCVPDHCNSRTSKLFRQQIKHSAHSFFPCMTWLQMAETMSSLSCSLSSCTPHSPSWVSLPCHPWLRPVTFQVVCFIPAWLCAPTQSLHLSPLRVRLSRLLYRLRHLLVVGL